MGTSIFRSADLAPFQNILHPSICTLMEAEAPCSLCRAMHPGVSGLKLPLSPPWALCMWGREGLIWVQKYVKGPVERCTIFIGQISECNICSLFCHLKLDSVPPYKQILHIHSTHNKYSDQNCIIWTNFLTKMIFFFIDYLGSGTYPKVDTNLHSVWVSSKYLFVRSNV